MSSHRALQHSQLRYVRTRSSLDSELRAVRGTDISDQKEGGVSETLPGDNDLHLNLVCALGTHDESFAKDDVLVNSFMFPPNSIPSGAKLRIVPLEADSPNSSFKRHGKGERLVPLGRRASGKQGYYDQIQYNDFKSEKAAIRAFLCIYG